MFFKDVEFESKEAIAAPLATKISLPIGVITWFSFKLRVLINLSFREDRKCKGPPKNATLPFTGRPG